MIAVTIRTSAAGRMPALVLLLLLMTSLFTAPPSAAAGALEPTLRAAESVRNDAASLDALIEPLANPDHGAGVTAAVPEPPRTITIVRTRTHQVLRV